MNKYKIGLISFVLSNEIFYPKAKPPVKLKVREK